MRKPLPLACKTSAAFVTAGEAAARREWTSDWNFPKEDRQPEHELVFGGVLPFDELIALPGFAEDAHALWDELLKVEQQ
jgi:exodeoxyribonuclease V gamma subunit